MENALKRPTKSGWEYLAAAFLFIFITFLAGRDTLMAPAALASNGKVIAWRSTDFIIFDTAAEIVRHGNPKMLYDLDTQHRVQSQRLGLAIDDTLPFIYPPYVALPLLLLPDASLKARYQAWLAVSAVLSFVLVALLLKAAGIHKRGALITASFLVVTALPWINATMEGQPMILMALGLIGGWLLLQNGRYGPAGALIVLTAIKPQAVAVPGLFLLMLAGRKAFMGAGLAALALLLACTLFFGAGIWQGYGQLLQVIATENGRYGVNIGYMTDLRALVFSLFAPTFTLLNAVSFLLMAAALGLAAWLGKNLRFAAPALQNLAFALLIPIGLLASPIVHIPTLLLLTIPLAFLFARSGRKAFMHVMLLQTLYALADAAFPASRPVCSVLLQLIIIIWAAQLFYQARRKAVGSF